MPPWSTGRTALGLKRYAGIRCSSTPPWLPGCATTTQAPAFPVRFDDYRWSTTVLRDLLQHDPTPTWAAEHCTSPRRHARQSLSLVTIRTLKLRRLGRLAGSALFTGGSKLRRSRHVDYRPAVRGFTVSSDRPFPYQVDGDFLGHVRSLEFRYEPDAIRLIVP